MISAYWTTLIIWILCNCIIYINFSVNLSHKSSGEPFSKLLRKKICLVWLQYDFNMTSAIAYFCLWLYYFVQSRQKLLPFYWSRWVASHMYALGISCNALDKSHTFGSVSCPTLHRCISSCRYMQITRHTNSQTCRWQDIHTDRHVDDKTYTQTDM